jgi:hypothetical protein
MVGATPFLGRPQCDALSSSPPCSPRWWERLRRTELTPAEERTLPYEANLPFCGDPSVLARIATNFAEKEAKFWRSELTIVEYGDIKPLAWRPWGLDLIPRRYCTATCHRLERPPAPDRLLPARGPRLHRQRLGRRVLRDGAGPQPRLQPLPAAWRAP